MRNFKLIKRKECIVLTWQGKMLVILIILGIIFSYFKFAPIFLSINKPVNAKILILDGQMPDYAIKKAIRLFDSCHYELIITTGGIIQSGYHISGNKTMAEYSRAMFIDYDFNPNKVISIPGGKIIKNRTYSSALSLKHWLEANNKEFKAIDVFAIGSHARRSRFLFRKALGKDFQVGSISINNPAYIPSKWWRSSIGAREVISETIAYTYVRFFFSK